MSEYLTNTTDLTAVADAIRAKGGTSVQLVFPAGFVSAINAIQAGGSASAISPSDITFYDYDGTVVAAWTLEELSNKSTLPDIPIHNGLTSQGWNWTLAELKSENRKANVGAMYVTDDGKTRIYIHLVEGRTSPMLGICPNGTVSVDWGDGTTPDTLTGTSLSTVKWTSVHEYAEPGDYVIKLTHTGTIGLTGSPTANQYANLLRADSGTDVRNQIYANSITKIEFGAADSIILSKYALRNCYGIESITIPSNLTVNGAAAMQSCKKLRYMVIPSGTYSIQSDMLRDCTLLHTVSIPKSAEYLSNNIFYGDSLVQNFPIPSSATFFGTALFYGCVMLTYMFVPPGVTSIGNNTFNGCGGMRVYDFTQHTAVPTLANTNAFTGIASDCEIRVSSSLVDTWKAATNWATYADHIVGV